MGDLEPDAEGQKDKVWLSASRIKDLVEHSSRLCKDSFFNIPIGQDPKTISVVLDSVGYKKNLL